MLVVKTRRMSRPFQPVVGKPYVITQPREDLVGLSVRHIRQLMPQHIGSRVLLGLWPVFQWIFVPNLNATVRLEVATVLLAGLNGSAVDH